MISFGAFATYSDDPFRFLYHLEWSALAWYFLSCFFSLSADMPHSSFSSGLQGRTRMETFFLAYR